MVRVVVDAMGGDHAPRVVVEGVIEAVRKFNVSVSLVGPSDVVCAELAKHKYDANRIAVVHADEVVGMDESPASAVRKKRNSSIVLGVNLVKEGQADAFFSAGNTGAVVCAGTLRLVIDAGANINPKPLHLLQYGLMGSSYYELILGKKNPRVGLLNVGEEESKGTDFVKETYQLLEKSDINFIGNVEGRDIFNGRCEVVVCDGFIGNVTLKVAESIAETINHLLRQELSSSWRGKLGFLLAKPCFRNFKKRLDYSEYGGAPLLGVNGVVIIGHGGSSAKAVMNAIRVAKEEVERNINQNILEHSRSVAAHIL
jgi:glycerol-3-phosphate acyltransferase PlsX